MNYNKIITVSAPANTMLMGEHAVLFGHRAIVCAVDKRITVTLIPRTDEIIIIDSVLKKIQTTLHDALHGDGICAELKFVLACIRAIKPNTGFELTIEAEFSHTVGLGSSACVTASCVYALLCYKNGQASFDEVFDIGLNVIHTVQKRGSGSDLAASVYGGVIGYTAKPRNIMQLLHTADQQQILPKINLYYAGYKTPTPQVLADVEKKAKDFPRIYNDIYQQMHNITIQAENAIKQQDWLALGKLMNIYHGLMCAIGVSDAKLSELVYSARAQPQNLGAKISGSGLGDCIITLSSSQSNIKDIPALDDHLLTQAHISPQGLMLVNR